MADNNSTTTSGGGGMYEAGETSAKQEQENMRERDEKDRMAGHQEWPMEVYTKQNEPDQDKDGDDILEFDLDEAEVEDKEKFHAIARYNSNKKYNAPGMFREMKEAWGIDGELHAEQFEERKFIIEFASAEERRRVVEGGPWWHRGDALIVVDYNGIVRPSEVTIDSIALWVRFYDLPPVMMNEDFTVKLGGQLGGYIKMDKRYSGYLRVRVKFPLGKALKPHMTVRIKGRGPMQIMIRYENVPHFNCEEGQLAG
ncbi:hypothetical protein QOZ80_8BG0666110 [Eleusine coracana subsp. coracana]|nr:hypothetical protein QOZ80_8BG0666110 [Eleusine coracana subsp. coracana]